CRMDPLRRHGGRRQRELPHRQPHPGEQMSTALKPPPAAPAAPAPRRSSRKRRGADAGGRVLAPTPLTRIGLIAVSVLSIFPLYWMIVIASRASSDAAKFPPVLIP